MWLLLTALAAAAPADLARAWLGDADFTVQERPWAGGAHLQLQQTLHGLPVHGAATRLSLGAAHTELRGGWVHAPADHPTLPADEAAQRVVVALGPRPLLWAPRTQLVWWADPAPRLAWAVDVGLQAPLGTLRVWVDAHTGEALHARPTSWEALGSVYDPSPALAEPTDVVLERLLAPDHLAGQYTVARSCDVWEISDALFGTNACYAASHHATPDAAGDYRFAPAPGSVDDPFAEVQVYVHVDRMAAWLDDRLGFQLGYVLPTNVNFPMANAFYGDFDGDGGPDLSFGHVEEGGVDFAYDADVVYHELGHAVIDSLAPDLPTVQADRYGMEWVSGAVHEGGADLWSMLLTLDPRTGEYAGSAFDRVAIRDLEEDRRCPDDLQGEVHADGQILGSFGWNLIDDPAVGPEITADLLYGAIPRWGTPLAWPDVGRSFLEAAADLLAAGAISGPAHAAILAHLDTSGMLDCGRVIDLDAAAPPELFLINGGLYGDLAEIPAGVQLSVTRDPEVRSYELSVTMSGDEGVGWAVYGRVGEPVDHRASGVPALGLAFATPETWDWRLEGGREDRVTLPLEGWEPGETLHLAFAGRNLGDIDLLDFQVARAAIGVHRVPFAEEEERGGCGCDSGRGGGSALLLLALLRRRRA